MKQMENPAVGVALAMTVIDAMNRFSSHAKPVVPSAVYDQFGKARDEWMKLMHLCFAEQNREDAKQKNP